MTQHLAAKQLYIAVEGIDGSGKTTAIKFMEHLIKQKGKTCLTIREPGTTGLGEKIRDIIKSLQTLNYKPSDTVLSMLVNTARLDMVEQCVEKATEQFILSDRCFLSTHVYQHSSNWNILLNQIGTKNHSVVPDIIFIFDVDYETATSRVSGRGLKTDDSFDSASRKDFELRREQYLKVGANPNLKSRIIYINGAQSREEVEEDIYRELCHYL